MKEKSHESRKKMTEYLAGLPSLMSGTLWVESVRGTILKFV